jgi:hypothetical protein
MVLWESVFALSVALVLSLVFALLTRRSIARGGFFWFLSLVFLTSWAGGIWIGPLGPSLAGVHWLPFFLFGLVAAGMFVFFVPRRPPKGRHETLEILEEMKEKRDLEKAAYVSFGIFFWILMLTLIAAIVIRYVMRF